MARKSYAKKPAAPVAKKDHAPYDAYVCQRNKAFMIITVIPLDPPLVLGTDVHDGWTIKAGPFRNGWDQASDEMTRLWRELQ